MNSRAILHNRRVNIGTDAGTTESLLDEAPPVRRLRILLIDDDRELCALLKEYLGQEGFDVMILHEGRYALEVLGREQFRAVILDIMLPGTSGLDVLRALRAQFTIPVVMLTARGDDVDRIVGLELGADDYLPKPFNIRELVARLRAVLRRVETSWLGSGTLEVGTLTLDRGMQTAAISGVPLVVTGAEFRILERLMLHAGEVVSRDQLVQAAVGRTRLPWDRAIDTHISNLRRKLAAMNSNVPIVSVRGVGYRIPR